MKLRRSGRLVEITHYLLQNPRKLISLSFFSEKFKSAKSSISEDLGIIKGAFEHSGIGTLQTIAGAAGGVKYIPFVSIEEAEEVTSDVMRTMIDEERLLPGGYLYMTDLLSDTALLQRVGKLFSSLFAYEQVHYVMTIETKGIPLAYAVANFLNVPVIIVRRDNKVTEGSTVSINYVSGSTKRIQTMTLSKRSLKENSNVLIIDDFMKAGGTITGMVNMVKEFQCNVAGIGVLIESEDRQQMLVDNYFSLVRLSRVDEVTKKIEVEKGNFESKLQKVLVSLQTIMES